MESLLLGHFPPSSSALSTGERIWRADTLKKACFASSYRLQAGRTFDASNILKCSLEHHLNVAQQRQKFYRRSSRTYSSGNIASEHPLDLEFETYDPNRTWNSIKSAASAFYQFSRLYTAKGIAACIVSVSLLAVEKSSDLSPMFFNGLSVALVAILLMNIYVVGLNQLTDIEIDKVNKPFLPLASGEYSIGTGVLIVASSMIMSFWLGWITGSWPMFWAIFIFFIFGTAYSIDLPLLRWKRSPVTAAMCIVATYAFAFPIASFLHMQTHIYRRPAIFPRPLMFATAFMSFFFVVVALFKDIPDIDGDEKFGIKSLAVRLGKKRVFWICISLLQMAYAFAILFGSISPYLWSKAITILGHCLLAYLLWARAKSINLGSKAAISSFYMFIWKLYYAEYLLIPLMR